jgi:FixJ family two-component response regulator
VDSSVKVAVIDDDAAFRQSLVRLLKSNGYYVIQFASADNFLAERPDEQLACAIVDLRMPGLGGIELQQRIKQIFPHVRIVFHTGQAEIQDSVAAMKAGAVDFLEKPVAEAKLLAAIRSAVERSQAAKFQLDHLAALQNKYQSLTRREREVFALVTAGLLNKQIAYKLGTTERTIKAHRRQVMEKLEAESLAHLVRIADQLGIKPMNQEEREQIAGRRFAPLHQTTFAKQPSTMPTARRIPRSTKEPSRPAMR